MIGEFVCDVLDREVTCTLGDDGVWESNSPAIGRFLNRCFGRDGYSPADGAFMRLAFERAVKELAGKVTRLSEPVPVSPDGIP